MKKLLAIGLACCLPTAIVAEDPADSPLEVGSVGVLVIEESAPIAGDVLCNRPGSEKAAADCMAVHRAVLTARVQKVSAREHARWM